MVISDTSHKIGVFTTALLTLNLGKSGQSKCVMTSRHSCRENWKVNGSIQGDNCNKDVTSR